MHRRKTTGTASVLLAERRYPTKSPYVSRSKSAAAPWSYCLVALAVVAALVLFVLACRPTGR